MLHLFTSLCSGTRPLPRQASARPICRDEHQVWALPGDLYMGLMALCVALAAPFLAPRGWVRSAIAVARASALALAKVPFLGHVGEQS
jgi:hypothetical protein